jgi:hypothetical protein
VFRPRLSLLLTCTVAATVLGCGQFRRSADIQFGDQNFKSAVALIELYKVRYGTYPNRLSDITFTGQWDQIWMSAVRYEKLSDGYELDLVRGWVGTPELSYPPEFWRGLGVRKTNVGRSGA